MKTTSLSSITPIPPPTSTSMSPTKSIVFHLQLHTLENEKCHKQYAHRKYELNKCRQAKRSKEKQLFMESPVETTQYQSLAHISKTFCTRIDAFSKINTCNTCMESYLGIRTTISSDGFICSCCCMENHGHLFSKWNNMDPRDQALVLSILTQVEEMLIDRVNPLLQVSHARGGQYKYSGHTISFPQNINTIAI
jgi:hypothetical protein